VAATETVRRSTQRHREETAVLQRLSTLDRFLPLWIALAMGVGLGLGSLIPSLDDGLDRLRVGTVSLPIALGLLLMMYPVLAKVRYEELGRKQHDAVSSRRFFGVSFFLSWLVGPLLMFAFAWLLLPNQPAYRTGVIIVGLARCIAMVLIWNDLAGGDRDRAAILVVFNALFQVAAYSLLGYFYLTVLPGWLGLDTQGFEVGIWEVARTVLIFLGIPLTAGFLTRRIGLKRKGRDWYEQRFVPRISPITLYGLLFTIVLLFAIQGDTITSQPLDVARIALPLLAYFAVMWAAGFAIGKLSGFPYAQTASLAFTVSSNDFELAIAVAVGVFGASSGQALAGVVGPLVEVPVLVSLVYLALLLARRVRWPEPAYVVPGNGAASSGSAGPRAARCARDALAYPEVPARRGAEDVAASSEPNTRR
jgi:ACR3 family arsenite transporter